MAITEGAQIEFWGAYTSRTMRPVWVAEELGLDYQLHAIGPRTGETQTDAYTELNPKQKIPCMVDRSVGGGLTITESLAYHSSRCGRCGYQGKTQNRRGRGHWPNL